MLNGSLKLFRVRGIQLAVHSSFFLLLAWIAKEGWDAGRWDGIGWFVGTFLAFFGCVVLHEFGHSFTAMHYGIGVRRILLMPIGGMAEFDAIPREPARELLITFAGPAVNFAIAGALWLVIGLPPGYPWSSEFPATSTGVAHLLLHANLVMGLFNLLPIFPMDGGRIFRALLAWRMPYLRATFWAATVGKLLAVLGAVIAVFYFESYLTAILFTFIYFAGDAEYRSVKRRETDDAHWREMLARVYRRDAAIDPPLLSR